MKLQNESVDKFCFQVTGKVALTKEWDAETNSLWLGIAGHEFICPRISKIHYKKQKLEYPYGYLVINIDDMAYRVICAANSCYHKYISGELEKKLKKVPVEFEEEIVRLAAELEM